MLMPLNLYTNHTKNLTVKFYSRETKENRSRITFFTIKFYSRELRESRFSQLTSTLAN